MLVVSFDFCYCNFCKRPHVNDHCVIDRVVYSVKSVRVSWFIRRT